MKHQLLLTFAFICLLSIQLNAQTKYYVSNSGDDNNNGTSLSTPWKTINKVNQQVLKPGDSVLFKSGDTWRATTLNITQSGTKDKPITISSYGEGRKPRLLSSLQATDWEETPTANVWKCTNKLDNPWYMGKDKYSLGKYRAQIFFELNRSDRDTTAWGIKREISSYNELKAEYDWAFIDGAICVYSEANPSGQYKAVEVPQKDNCIYIAYNEYINVNNLELAYGAFSGLRSGFGCRLLNGLRVTNCLIHHMAFKSSGDACGIYVYHSESYYAHNEFHDCGRRALSLSTVKYKPSGVMKNILVEHNYFHDGWHTTGVDIINSDDHIVDSIIIRNNLFEGNPNIKIDPSIGNPTSNHIFVANQSPGVGQLNKIYVYNNIFTYMHGKGVALQRIDTAFIINNTFYYFNPTATNQAMIHLASGKSHSSSTNINIYNNITNSNIDSKVNSDLYNVFLGERELEADECKINYNLYYSDYTNTRLMILQNQIYNGDPNWHFSINNWSDYLTIKPNCDNYSPFPSDPMFVDASKGNFALQEGSPAIGAGKVFDWITTDYNGNPRSTSAPSIGAIEFGTVTAIKNEPSQSGKVKLYPNPASTFVTIEQERNSKSQLCIYSLTGKLVMIKGLNNKVEQVDVSELSKGLYVLKITSGNNIATKKLQLL